MIIFGTKSDIKLTLLAVLLALSAVAAGAQSAGSPLIYEVKFQRGRYVKKGSVAVPHPCPKDGPTECGNGNYTNLSIKGKKGDRIRIALSSATGGAVFSVFYSDFQKPLDKASATTAWTGTLPEDGDYLITVYTFKSSTPFTLTVFDH